MIYVLLFFALFVGFGIVELLDAEDRRVWWAQFVAGCVLMAIGVLGFAASMYLLIVGSMR